MGAGARSIRAIRLWGAQARIWSAPRAQALTRAHGRYFGTYTTTLERWRRPSVVFDSYSPVLGQKSAQVPDLAPIIATKTCTICAGFSGKCGRRNSHRLRVVGGAGGTFRRRAGASGSKCVGTWTDGARPLSRPSKAIPPLQASYMGSYTMPGWYLGHLAGQGMVGGRGGRARRHRRRARRLRHCPDA